MARKMWAEPAGDADIEEEFTGENLDADGIQVNIKWKNDTLMEGAALQVFARLDRIDVCINKDKVFTCIAMRSIIAGVIQNRLNRLFERYLTKKAVKETMR